MTKKIIIFIGAPGSGKDTQAFKLARKHNFFLFQSSAILKRALATMDPSDPIRQQAEDLYRRGEMITPDLVARIFANEIRRLNEQEDGSGIAFSGCFRTVPETESLLPLVEELFGKENVHVFFLDISKQESAARNLARKVCQANGHPLPDLPEFRGATECRYDGSPFVQRDTDVDPEVVAHRYDVFMKDSYPVIELLKSRGYEVITVKGERPIQEVEQDIASHTNIHSFSK